MRTIETKMLAAIAAKQYFGLDNTVVHYNNQTDQSEVRLFGNHILTYCHGKPDALQVNKRTFLAHPTRTTVSRLRALGINARIKQGQPTIDGVAI